MAAPVTYAEWVNLLDAFGTGDDTALESLRDASFTVDAGTGARFYFRVEEVYKKRKQIWLDNFQRAFQYQNCKTNDDFEIVLRNGKQNLIPLSRFVAIKGLPEDLKNTLKKDLEEFVSEIKTSLEGNVSKIARGRENMVMCISTFKLIDLAEVNKVVEKNSTQNANEIIPVIGRKIIF